jgi:hypothetical protein
MDELVADSADELWAKHEREHLFDRIEALTIANTGLHDEIEDLREKLAAAYIALSGTDVHASDCATSNAPAYEPGPCDCKGAEQ